MKKIYLFGITLIILLLILFSLSLIDVPSPSKLITEDIELEIK